jgi:hypothetical protein
MQKLSPKELDRLTKLCGLFSSNHPAEIAEAAKKADLLLRERGLTWPDVLGVPRIASMDGNGADDLGGFYDWRSAIQWLLDRRDQLTEWECEFCEKVSGWHSISPKQRVVVAGMLERLGRGRL